MKVTIEDRNDDGRGRARLGRRAVLVSQAHPGEEVTVKVDVTTRGTLQGRVGQILRRDASRAEHACSHEFHCTGCPLLACDDAAERAFKEARLARALATLPWSGPTPSVERPTGPFGYRQQAKRVAVRRGPRVLLGSYVAGTHRITDNRGCPVLAPELRDALDGVADHATHLGLRVHGTGFRGLRYVVGRRSRATGQVLLLVVTSDGEDPALRRLGEELLEARDDLVGVHALLNEDQGNALMAGERLWGLGESHVEEKVLGHRHRVGPTSFFQVNPEGANRLFSIAVEMAGEGALVVEGFAGVGALTLPLAARFDRVIAIESHPESVQSLRTAAGREGVGEIEVVEGRVEDRLPSLAPAPGAALVLDPPRKGLGDDLASTLARGPWGRIVLLSCDPNALRRDLAPMLSAGWQIQRVAAIDQFPRTAHVETVTLVERPGP